MSGQGPQLVQPAAGQDAKTIQQEKEQRQQDREQTLDTNTRTSGSVNENKEVGSIASLENVGIKKEIVANLAPESKTQLTEIVDKNRASNPEKVEELKAKLDVLPEDVAVKAIESALNNADATIDTVIDALINALSKEKQEEKEERNKPNEDLTLIKAINIDIDLEQLSPNARKRFKELVIGESEIEPSEKHKELWNKYSELPKELANAAIITALEDSNATIDTIIKALDNAILKVTETVNSTLNFEESPLVKLSDEAKEKLSSIVVSSGEDPIKLAEDLSSLIKAFPDNNISVADFNRALLEENITLEDVYKLVNREIRQEHEIQNSSSRIERLSNGNLSPEEVKSYERYVKEIESSLVTDTDREAFEVIKNRFGEKLTAESLAVMEELATLSKKESIHESLQGEHQKIFSDILYTLATDSVRNDQFGLNQGNYAICALLSTIGKGVQTTENGGNVVRILEITREQLQSASCDAFKHIEEGTFLYDSLNPKNLENGSVDQMHGGVIAAALAADTFQDFTREGRYVINRKTSATLPKSKINDLYKNIFGNSAVVVDNSDFKKLFSTRVLEDGQLDTSKELLGENLKEFCEANPKGFICVVEMGGSYHALLVTGCEKDINGKWTVQFKNSYSKDVLLENGALRVDALELSEFAKGVQFALIDPNNKKALELLNKLGIEPKDGEDIKDDNIPECPPNSSLRPSSGITTEMDKLIETNYDNVASLAQEIYRISKGYYTEEEMNVLLAPADGTGIQVQFIQK